jgi:hypothetical protein
VLDAKRPLQPRCGTQLVHADESMVLWTRKYMALVEKTFKAADPDNDGTLDLKELNSPAGQALLKLIQ